jgi:hypothetical protein
MQRRCSEPPREPPHRPIAEYATHHGGLGIGFVAIPIQLLLAEDASSAGYVERHQYVVAEAPVYRVFDLRVLGRLSSEPSIAV